MTTLRNLHRFSRKESHPATSATPCRAHTHSGGGGTRAGFTFLEILVALAVVSISIVALLNCHSLSLRGYLHSQIISRGTLLAEEKINEIEARGLPPIDEAEAEEYENGLRYIVEEGEFYEEDPLEVDFYQPEWRAEYWWRTIVEDTEYENVRKVTVEVFSRRFIRESIDIDPWDAEQVSPTIRLVTYMGSTNQREDSRSGPAPTLRRQPRAS